LLESASSTFPTGNGIWIYIDNHIPASPVIAVEYAYSGNDLGTHKVPQSTSEQATPVYTPSADFTYILKTMVSTSLGIGVVRLQYFIFVTNRVAGMDRAFAWAFPSRHAALQVAAPA